MEILLIISAICSTLLLIAFNLYLTTREEPKRSGLSYEEYIKAERERAERRHALMVTIARNEAAHAIAAEILRRHCEERMRSTSPIDVTPETKRIH